MGIYAEDLREFIIRPTLILLDDWSEGVENLLVGTAAQESQLGYRMQASNETGLGIYRISAHTHLEVWDNYLVTDPESASRVRGLASQQQFLKSPHNELISNLSYSTAIAWMIYKRHEVNIADCFSSTELAKLWAAYYCHRDVQSHQIEFTSSHIEQFIDSYEKFVCVNKPLAA